MSRWNLYQLRRWDLRIFGRFDVVHNMLCRIFLYQHGNTDEVPRRSVLDWWFVDMYQVPLWNVHLIDWRFLMHRLPGGLHVLE